MITQACRRLRKDGHYEQSWLFNIFETEKFYIDYRKAEYQVDLDVEFRLERAQIIVSNFSRILSLEHDVVGDSKKIYHVEAYNRSRECLQFLIDNKRDINMVCKTIIKMKPVLQLLARYEKQFNYFCLLMKSCEEALVYEEQIQNEIL